MTVIVRHVATASEHHAESAAGFPRDMADAIEPRAAAYAENRKLRAGRGTALIQLGREAPHALEKLVHLPEVVSRAGVRVRQALEPLHAGVMEKAAVSFNCGANVKRLRDRANAGPPLPPPPFDEHVHRPRRAGGVEVRGELLHRRGAVDQTVKLEIRNIPHRGGERGNRRLSDHLVGDEDAANAGPHADHRLAGVGDRDRQRARVELSVENLRAHGCFAMRGEQEPIAPAPLRHRTNVMSKGRFLQQQEREMKIARQNVPAAVRSLGPGDAFVKVVGIPGSDLCHTFRFQTVPYPGLDSARVQSGSPPRAC